MVHQYELATEASSEEEPVSHGAMDRNISRYTHAVNLAVWDAEEGAVEEGQPR
jgi:hypothetical protein